MSHTLTRTFCAAEEAKLPFFVVADAGHTQVARGSLTVLAIGPAPESLVNQVTGSLVLL
jgi:peptidyl-tRNA hydrolase, PTH2 family